MSRQKRATSEDFPKFRSTKYNTLFKQNRQTQLQISNAQNTQPKNQLNITRFRKLTISNSKKKSMPFTAQISINSQKSYLETFNSLMCRHHNKQNQINVDLDIVLTNYKLQFDENESNFTLLDVVAKPLLFINGELNAIQRDLKHQSCKRQTLKSQLKELDFMINKQIENITKQAFSKISELRKVLRHSELVENERKLRNRKELKLIEKGHHMNVRKLESVKDRNLEMQTLIFGCQPLQLEFHHDEFAQLKKDEYL